MQVDWMQVEVVIRYATLTQCVKRKKNLPKKEKFSMKGKNRTSLLTNKQTTNKDYLSQDATVNSQK